MVHLPLASARAAAAHALRGRRAPSDAVRSEHVLRSERVLRALTAACRRAARQNACPVGLHASEDPAHAADAGLFDVVTLTAPDGASPMPQTLWPRHCVQDSWGAALHDELRPPAEHVVVYKGTDAVCALGAWHAKTVAPTPKRPSRRTGVLT